MQASKAKRSSQDYAFINFLRGWAALLVALLHFYLNTQEYYKNSTWSQTIYPYIMGEFDIGKFAVGVFFLVSGFLIPYSLERSKSISLFAIHRIFRLYPAYWFSIIINLLLNAWLAYEVVPNTWTVLANLTMLQGYLRHPDLIGAFWTLQIEVTFYIICGVLFWIGFSRKSNLIIYTCLLMSFLASLLSHAGIKVPMALFIALTLMYCADALRCNVKNLNQLWIVTALSLIPICLLAYGDIARRYILCYWAAMIVFRLSYYYQAKWFKKPIHTFLADISYSVYLLHGPIGIQIARAIAAKGGSPILGFGLAFTATIVVSWIVYKVVEYPAITLGRRISSYSFQQTSKFPRP
jgi:peptidoglycan/LPS O-acetylase OafA/YrhL